MTNGTNKELSQVNARMKALRDEIGLTALTSGLANLTLNTASFVAKAQELVNVV